MRFGIAFLLILVGGSFPLLLNGQVFTNFLMGIGCLGGAVALCLFAERGKDGRTQPSLVKRFVACLCLVAIVVLAVQLPSAYQFQKNFNRRTEENREKRRLRMTHSDEHQSVACFRRRDVA